MLQKFKYIVSWQKKSSLRCLSTAAVYVHWPYCKRRCTYCNFNKYIDKNVNHERMKSCLVKEADTLMELAGMEKTTSVFFGGGTPSLALPNTIETLLAEISKKTSLSSDSEISMEVNPTSLEMERLKEFKLAGINRVSIGVQTLNTTGLQILGRDHSVNESLRCLETAKSLLPGQVSVDLIFGWPGQTLDMWLQELGDMIALCDNHISLYQLTLERGTQLFKDIHAGKLTPVDSQMMEDMYLHAVKMLATNKFERYEVSNFARQNSYSKHNMAYWTGQQYIGIGPGAHGRFRPVNEELREARVQTLEPHDWMWEVEKFGHATRKVTPLSRLNQLEELLAVGLRTKWGISCEMWSKVLPEKDMKDLLLPSPEVQTFVEKSLLAFHDRGICASDKGINIIDSMLPALLNALSENYQSGCEGKATGIT